MLANGISPLLPSFVISRFSTGAAEPETETCFCECADSSLLSREGLLSWALLAVACFSSSFGSV